MLVVYPLCLWISTIPLCLRGIMKYTHVIMNKYTLPWVLCCRIFPSGRLSGQGQEVFWSWVPGFIFCITSVIQYETAMHHGRDFKVSNIQVKIRNSTHAQTPPPHFQSFPTRYTRTRKHTNPLTFVRHISKNFDIQLCALSLALVLNALLGSCVMVLLF